MSIVFFNFLNKSVEFIKILSVLSICLQLGAANGRELLLEWSSYPHRSARCLSAILNPQTRLRFSPDLYDANLFDAACLLSIRRCFVLGHRHFTQAKVLAGVRPLNKREEENGQFQRIQ